MAKETEKANPRTLKAIYEALPAEGKGVIAFMFMYILFFAGSMFLGPVLQEQHCWELQAKETRFFKFNACTGEVIEITEEYLAKARSLSKNSR